MEENQGSIVWNTMRYGKCHREGTFSRKGPIGSCFGAQDIQLRKADRDPMGVCGGVLRGGFRRDAGEMLRAEQEGAKEGLRHC